MVPLALGQRHHEDALARIELGLRERFRADDLEGEGVGPVGLHRRIEHRAVKRDLEHGIRIDPVDARDADRHADGHGVGRIGQARADLGHGVLGRLAARRRDREVLVQAQQQAVLGRIDLSGRRIQHPMRLGEADRDAWRGQQARRRCGVDGRVVEFDVEGAHRRDAHGLPIGDNHRRPAMRWQGQGRRRHRLVAAEDDRIADRLQ